MKECADLGPDCFEPGLQALGSDSLKIRVSSSRSLRGSVNFDKCLREKYPNDPQWDYGIDVGGEVLYVEVHPADSGNVNEVLNKLRSFQRWRQKVSFGPVENELGFWWVASGRIHIVKKSRYFRLLASMGVRGPCSVLQVKRRGEISC